jgi:hypothetical protein
VTNVMVVVGSLRASRDAAAIEAPVEGSAEVEIAEAQPGAEPVVAVDRVASAAASRRWMLDATMLVLLGLSACILWYGNQPPERRPRTLQHWVQLLHLRRSH